MAEAKASFKKGRPYSYFAKKCGSTAGGEADRSQKLVESIRAAKTRIMVEVVA